LGFVVQQIPEPDLIEVTLRPSAGGLIFMTEVSPLANRRAVRTRVAARRSITQKVGQIEKARRFLVAMWQVLFQPKQLWRLHLE
jgi:hypothetical protein